MYRTEVESEPRKAADISRLLRKHGIKTGYRYSQFGYRDAQGREFSEPGVMVSRKVSSRYDGEVEDDAVTVYLISDANGVLDPDSTLEHRVVTILNDEGIAHFIQGSSIRIPDRPIAHVLASETPERLLRTYAALTHRMTGRGEHYDSLREQRDLVGAEILRRMG